jgi:hypothetical protein
MGLGEISAARYIIALISPGRQRKGESWRTLFHRSRQLRRRAMVLLYFE